MFRQIHRPETSRQRRQNFRSSGERGLRGRKRNPAVKYQRETGFITESGESEKVQRISKFRRKD
jgi:hypothetical protein